MTPKTPQERVLAMVTPEPNTGCWLWMGAQLNSGYGKAHVGREALQSDRQTTAHRAAYEAFRGPVPDGLVLDHRCRVKMCANPDHLDVVTQQENTKRSPVGLPSGRCARGHEMTAANTILKRGRYGPRRRCRACDNALRRKEPTP